MKARKHINKAKSVQKPLVLLGDKPDPMSIAMQDALIKGQKTRPDLFPPQK